MFVKQLSVFIENREGRLEQVTDVLKTQNINILSLSMADTTEYGMLRMVVSNPEVAKKALREEGFSAMLTDVLAVKLEDKVGELHKMTHILCSQGLNIEYMYAFANGSDAAAVLKSDDPARVIDILKGSGFDVYSADEAYRANM